ncbi:MAG: DUF1801 domain-containing protein [Chitinophagaceae bacterium]
MKSEKLKPKNIDKYIAGFPKDIQNKLEEIRATIKKAAPEAAEIISYSIPAFKLNGILVYFAGYKNHIGFYPTSTGIKNFQDELSDYKTSKGAIQFPIDKPLPINLITKIVRFKVKENFEILEQERKPQEGFLSLLSAPARRALEREGIKNLKQLSKFSEDEILKLHGIGQSSMPKLRDALKKEGLSFAKK